jgi:hypothetical protein
VPTSGEEGMRRLLAAILLFASPPLAAAEIPALTSHGLLAQLQAFMQTRNVDASDLTPEDSLRLMVDWYRSARASESAPAADALVFRYGGWSEGCATAFNVSVLRRVKALDGETDLAAGITMMFEPSGRADLKPYSSALSDWKSTEEFLQAVEQSPAFKLLAHTRPMAVLLETGTLR